jgi:hypothetical protein
VENHVHRTARLGTPMLITAGWYKASATVMANPSRSATLIQTKLILKSPRVSFNARWYYTTATTSWQIDGEKTAVAGLWRRTRDAQLVVIFYVGWTPKGREGEEQDNRSTRLEKPPSLGRPEAPDAGGGLREGGRDAGRRPAGSPVRGRGAAPAARKPAPGRVSRRPAPLVARTIAQTSSCRRRYFKQRSGGPGSNHPLISRKTSLIPSEDATSTVPPLVDVS